MKRMSLPNLTDLSVNPPSDGEGALEERRRDLFKYLLDRFVKKLDSLNSFDEEDISELSPFDSADAKLIVDTSEVKEDLDNAVTDDTNTTSKDIQKALVRFLRSTQQERDKAIRGSNSEPQDHALTQRELLARASVLISAVVVDPSARVNYTQEYEDVIGGEYEYDADRVAQQDCLVEACWKAVDEKQINPSQYVNKFHGNDANFSTMEQREMKDTLPAGVSPLEVTVPCDCFVYTCGGTPSPLPKTGDLLYADDSLVWTHTSRLWSYPCWGKSWSKAAKEKSRDASICTRFVIRIKKDTTLACFPMDTKHIFQGEVHIAEAPLDLGALLDSLVLYRKEGVRLRVTEAPGQVDSQSYGYQVDCDFLTDQEVLAEPMRRTEEDANERSQERCSRGLEG